jgi:capsular polysaccharide biosynthesis protein
MRIIEAQPARDLGRILGSLPSGGPYRRNHPIIRGPRPVWLEEARKVREREEAIPPGGLIIQLKNAVVHDGVIFTENGTIVRESLINRAGEEMFLGISRTDSSDLFCVDSPPATPLLKATGRHVLLKQLWDSNYGHWLIESLSRMTALRDIIDFLDVKFVVSAAPQEMLRVYIDSLHYYGITRDQIVILGAEVQSFEELIYPTPLTEQPWVKAPLSIRALENLGGRVGPQGDQPERVFLARPGEARRQLLNRAEVRELFLAQGYVEINPAAMTFEQQVRTFSRARQVVGVLGAECTNLVFAPAGVRLLGFAPEGMQDDFFWDLVSHKEGDYFCLHGLATDPARGMNSEFTVDMDQLRAIKEEFDAVKHYDHIVSLGGDGQTAHQIRRRFGIEPAHVFDRWVTPTDSLVKLLVEEFTDLFGPDNMEMVEDSESVMCAKYGMLHHHDFERDPSTGMVIAASIPIKCEINKAKYGFLLRKLRELRGRVLFVRYGIGYIPYRENAPTTPSMINELMRLLDEKLPMIESLNLLLLNVDIETHRLDARVFVDAVDGHGVTSWGGSDLGWDEIFDRFHIRKGAAESRQGGACPFG